MKLFLGLVFLCLGGSPAWAEPVGPSLVARGQQFYQKNQFMEALAAFQQAAAADPADAKAQQGMGNALLQLGRPAEALAAYQRSLALKPDNPALVDYVPKLQASLGTGSTGAAAGADDDALAEKLQDARSALESRDLDKALALYNEGAKAAPKDPEWARGQAETLYAQGHFDQAREAMTRARKLAPDNKALKDLEARYYHPGLEDEAKGGDAFPPLWRSALLPGWGQYYNGQHDKALIVGGVTLGLLAATVVTYFAAGSALDDYHALGPGTSNADFDAAFSKADGLAIANEAIGLCFYGAYAYNVFDAGTHARPAVSITAQGGVRVALAEAHF